ncbi:HNH endonuclease [Arthrobacter pigmenti]
MENRPVAGAVPTPGASASGSGALVGSESDVLGEVTGALRKFSRQAVAGQSGVATAESAAGFAASVEELSRTVEHLQVVAAGRLERVRSEAETSGEADSWVTPEGKRQGEYRNTADYLRDVVRVNRPEAAKRLKLAAQLLPTAGLAGQPVPPALEQLAVAMAEGDVSAQAAVTTQTALAKAKTTGAGPQTLEAMESSLTEVAVQRDPQFVAVAAARWLNHIDQDGQEPSEAQLRHRQGVFLKGRRAGLHRMEILATDDQYEHLITTMNAAANPRARGCGPDTNTGAGDEKAGDSAGGSDQSTAQGGAAGSAGCATEAGGSIASGNAGSGSAGAAAGGDAGDRDGSGPVPAAAVDQRSVAQKRLDGLVAACDIALAGNGLPATGGHRPQIMAVIDYQELLAQLRQVTGGDEDEDARLDAIFGTGSNSSAGSAAGFAHRTSAGGTGSYMFGGPVHAGNIRQLACDAEIIPVVMAGNGQILDVGTGRRIFPPHLRRALVARDGGCTFPGCTMPAPWTEAHHIKYATDDGETSTDNGCLLCSFHHHLVHKEKWAITVRNGVPWFIPPAYVDPDRRPIRNHYFNRKPHHRKYHQTEIEYANTG